jgi:hypothetical protein
VVHNQLGTNPTKKELLKTRLNSLDISGLQLGQRLSGHTLVQYAGSLTGRDFRIIAQVAPYVLHDLVPTACFDAWVSLCNLVPLLWQPTIADIDEYIVSRAWRHLHPTNANFQARLETAISDFLYRVICWTPRWFNKPKFHFIIHIPAHIQRFGPAVLFATETFESYNAIIRGKSVHSNHLAPSRDIALSFAHYSRVRHLLSGGRHLFRDSEQSRKYLHTFGPSLSNPGNASSDYAGKAGIWRQLSSTGPHMHALLSQHASASGYVGPSIGLSSRFGTCVPNNKQACRPYGHTDMAHYFPVSVSPPLLALSSLSRSTCFTAISMTLLNGDVCRIGDWVLYSHSADNTEAPALGRIREVLIDVARTEQRPRPDAILLQQADITEWIKPYQMPRVSISNNWAAVDIAVSGLLSESRWIVGLTLSDFYSKSYVAQMYNIDVTVTAVSQQGPRLFIKNGRRQIKGGEPSCTTTQKI